MWYHVTSFVIVITVSIFALATVASFLRHVRDARTFPFLAAMQQGICPKCGGTGRAPVRAHNTFWQHFACVVCGFSVKAHLRE